MIATLQSVPPPQNFPSSGSLLQLPPASVPNEPQQEAKGAAPSTQKQYCDACNSSCCLMNGRRRKLQARYEGFLLVKRVQGDTSASRYLVSCGGAEAPRNPSFPTGLAGGAPYPAHLGPKCCNPTYERRYSCGDLATDEGAASGGRPHGPTRSISHVATNDRLWEKLVNLPAEDNLLNNNVPASVVENSHKSRKLSSVSSQQQQQHQRLSRKKSRSQDNLVGRRIKLPPPSGAPAEGAADEEVILNNRVIAPAVHLHSPLSRSEGNIHNVTATNRPRSATPDGVAGGVMRAERAEDLAKLPKKFLDRVSDEVGQIVFYLERWREEYVVLTHTAIAIKAVSPYRLW